jgi:phosphatidylglycerophosphatase A
MPPPESKPFSLLLASGCYSGFSPIAPGTMGSLVGMAFFLIPGFSSPWILVTITVITFFAGVLAATRHSSSSSPDPSFIVVDEIVGMWIAMIQLPLTPLAIVCSFLGFRLFDILKPYPCWRLEKLPGGWGIMLDDVAAAIYANLLTRILLGMIS